MTGDDGSTVVGPSSRPVTSVQNRRVKELRRLHRRRARRETGLTLLEGPRLVEGALRAGADIVEVWASDGSGDVTCTPEVIAALSTTSTPQSPVAVVRIPDDTAIRAVDTLVLWDVSDPGNAGTMVRTAAALGWDVAATPATTDLWAPKVLRAGGGGHFATRLSRVHTLSDLAGLTLVAALTRGGADPTALPSGRYALIVGNESHGLPDDVAAAAVPVTLPLQAAVESLNAAMAAGILMWQLSRPPPSPPAVVLLPAR